MRRGMARPHLILLFIALALLALTSCGGGRLKTFPVTGQVLYNDQPLKGVTVAFHPVDPKNNTGYPPHGKTDDTGKFTLTTFLKDDGCPAGEWKVAIAFEVESVDDGSDQSKRLTFQVPVKYWKAETTDLKATIGTGTNNLDPFKLVGPPRPVR